MQGLGEQEAPCLQRNEKNGPCHHHHLHRRQAITLSQESIREKMWSQNIPGVRSTRKAGLHGAVLACRKERIAGQRWLVFTAIAKAKSHVPAPKTEGRGENA
jgi:hypothetical protein